MTFGSAPQIVQPLVKRKRSYALLALTIILWSLSPTALVECTGLLPSEIMPSVAVVVAALTLVTWFALFNRKVLASSFAILSGRAFAIDWLRPIDSLRPYLWLGFLSVLGFCLYPFFYVQAMNGAASSMSEGGGSIIAPFVTNVINYTWPCFAVLAGWKFVHERLTAHNILGVALAFGGALLAVSSTSGLQPFILSQFYALSSPALVLVPQHIDRHVWFFAYAALGAVIWGIYTALLPRAPSEDKNCVPIPASAIYLTLLLVAATIHVFYLASQWKLIAYFQYSIRTKSLLFFLAYSILSLGVAHNLFARVRRDHLISITALAASTYLVFAGGTLLLFVIERPILTPPIAAGFALIITGIHLGRNWQLMSPGSAFLISTIVCYGLSSFFAPPAAIQPQVQATPEFYVDFLHVLTAVFAILSGFTLSRAIERNNKQELCFTSLMEHAARIAKILMAHNASDSLILRLKSAIEHLYGCHMVGGQIREQDLALKSLNDCLDEIAGLIRNHSTDPAQRAAVLNVLQGARRDATSWAANSRFQRVAGFEWLVLMSLMFIMFLISFRVDTGEAIIRLARSAFDAALVIILFAIAEFNAGRPSRSFTLLKFLFLSFPEPYQSPSQTIATQLRYNPVSELLVVTSVAAIAFIGWLKS